MYVVDSGREIWVIGLGFGFTYPIGTWVCVWVAVVLGRVDGWQGPWSGRVWCCYVCVCYQSGLFVLMAGPGICILC